MGASIAAGLGGAGGTEALAWATEQAERTGWRLVLVHVCVPGSPLDGTTRAGIELIDPPTRPSEPPSAPGCWCRRQTTRGDRPGSYRRRSATVAAEASCPVAVVPLEQHEGDPL